MLPNKQTNKQTKNQWQILQHMSKKKKRGHGWTSVCRKRYKWEPFTRNPKKTLVGVSNIPTAGLGLFLLESVKKGERIVIYSGEVLNKEQIMNSDSK